MSVVYNLASRNTIARINWTVTNLKSLPLYCTCILTLLSP